MSIVVENLSFSYSKKEVLHDISFEIEQGEFVTILGANGVGKSTLFRCILGLLQNYTGRIFLDGTDMHSMSPNEIARKIAYIPQYTASIFNYSVENIVLMGTTASLHPLSSPKEEEMKRVTDSLEKIGISHLRERCFHLLSGGEKQLTIIARALAQNTKIIMLDEPTASLDYGNQMVVLNQMRSLADEGYTIIQTSHSPEHSYMFSDRIIAMKSGEILCSGSPKDVIIEDIVSQIYGVNVRIASLYDDKMRVCTSMN